MRYSTDNQILIYQSKDGLTKIDVTMQEDNLWLTQAQIADLFGKNISTISRHIRNILAEKELDEKSNLHSMQIPNSDKPVKFHSLDMIIAVGYRVRSNRGTQFRQWATGILHEYLQKGFAMNDEKLKENGGGLYFKELLERIRDIRASEKVLYRQVLQLYATSLDYDPEKPETIRFFKIVQNKLHYATSGKTAPELIWDRANAELPFMGLTTFKGTRPTQSEVTVAKNYMSEKELFVLRRLVNSFFDYAETKAIEEEPMKMQDWIDLLDKHIVNFDRRVLESGGTISELDAKGKALSEYGKYKAKLPDSLTDVEKAYLDTLKDMQKRIKEGGDSE
jgi:hypothetical protein